MKVRVIILMCLCALLTATDCPAQLYTGMSGLIKNPSADMNPTGEAVIAAYYLDKHFTPGDVNDRHGFYLDGEKYNTADFSIGLTPFSWMEIGFTMTLMKSRAEGNTKARYNQKDRFLSLKFLPLKEGKYWPAIAIGSNDFIGSALKRRGNGGSGAGYFSNYYIVATKHFVPKGHDIGVTLGYRYSPVSHSKKWQGVIAGATWRPKWVPQLRVVGEWTAHEFNIGVDCLLWRHLFLQAALIGGRYPSGGIAYQVNLF